MRVRATIEFDGEVTQVADRGLVGREGVFIHGQDLYIDGRWVGTWVGNEIRVDAETAVDLREKAPKPRVARVVATTLDVLLPLPTP